MRKERFKRSFVAIIMAAAILFSAAQTSIQVQASQNTSETEADSKGTETDNKTLEFLTADNVLNEGLDVVFCIDNSGSIWKQQAIRDQAVRSLVNLAVNQNVRVGGVYFADHVYRHFALTDLKSESDVKEILDNFLNLTDQNKDNKDTNIGSGLKVCEELFENQDENRKRIVVLFSDGINENLEGNTSYKEKADAETKKYVQKLGSENIDIYCVYLNKSNKRSNQDYLKQIVNYFGDTTEYDHRFMNIPDSSIGELCNRFVDVFYAAQNNMKYCEFNCDSFGRYSFYIPDTNVRQVQIFLKNVKEGEKLKVSCESEEVQVTDRVDGTLRYVTIENPKAGKWTIEAATSASAVTGTLAFYADVTAGIQLCAEGEPVKNTNAYVETTFANAEGSTLDAFDPSAKVKATVTAEGQKIWEGVLEPKNGKYRSENFLISEYGTYKTEVQVVFEEFLDLQYSTAGFSVVPHAPKPESATGILNCHKIKENGVTKYQYVIDKEKLFSDPENEELFFDSFNSLNSDNPAVITEENDKLFLTTEKFGDVEVEVYVHDASNEIARASIKGYLIAGSDIMFVIGLVIVLIAAIIAIVLYRKYKIRQSKKLPMQELMKLDEKYRSIRKIYEAGEKKYDELNKSYSGVHFSEVWEQLCTKAEGLLPAQIRHLEIEEMIDEKQGVQLNHDVRTAREYCETALKQLSDAMSQSVEGRFAAPTSGEADKSSVKDLMEKAERRKNAMKHIEHGSSVLRDYVKNYMAAVKAAEKRIGIMEGKLIEINRISKDPFKCQIRFEYLDKVGRNYRSHNGAKDLRSQKAGAISLDELRVWSGNGTVMLGELFGMESNVVIYPYKSEGIQIVGLTDFYYEEKAAQEQRKTVNHKAILLIGYEYELNIPIEGQTIKMIMKVTE